jgi:hypothetical protein
LRRDPLEALIEIACAENPRDYVEQFVASRLAEGDVWDSPRVSDGVSLCRLIERAPERVRICGKIWEIDPQIERSFWLDVEWHHGSQREANWTLYFDIDVALLSARRARHAAVVIAEPGEVAWHVVLTGKATSQ